jgi:hypothetical protein
MADNLRPKLAKTASGQTFSFSPEHTSKARINAGNKNAAKTVEWLIEHYA